MSTETLYTLLNTNKASYQKASYAENSSDKWHEKKDDFGSSFEKELSSLYEKEKDAPKKTKETASDTIENNSADTDNSAHTSAEHKAQTSKISDEIEQFLQSLTEAGIDTAYIESTLQNSNADSNAPTPHTSLTHHENFESLNFDAQTSGEAPLTLQDIQNILTNAPASNDESKAVLDTLLLNLETLGANTTATPEQQAALALDLIAEGQSAGLILTNQTPEEISALRELNANTAPIDLPAHKQNGAVPTNINDSTAREKTTAPQSNTAAIDANTTTQNTNAPVAKPDNATQAQNNPNIEQSTAAQITPETAAQNAKAATATATVETSTLPGQIVIQSADHKHNRNTNAQNNEKTAQTSLPTGAALNNDAFKTTSETKVANTAAQTPDTAATQSSQEMTGKEKFEAHLQTAAQERHAANNAQNNNNNAARTANNASQNTNAQAASGASMTFDPGAAFLMESAEWGTPTTSTDPLSTLAAQAQSTTTLTSLSSTITQATSATQQHPATQMIAMTLNKGAVNGQSKTLTLELDPPELGRVEISMEISKESGVKTVVTAERPETFLMMQRDSNALEKALSDAGLDLSANDSLTFELADDNSFNQDGSHDGARFGAKATFESSENGDMEVIETSLNLSPDPETGLIHYNILA